MQFIKADVISQVLLGPFVDISDGYTLISTAAIGAADASLIFKSDGSSAALTGTLTAVDDGYYSLTVSALEADTEGLITVAVEDVDLFLPVRADFMVVNANVFDSLFAAFSTDYLEVDTQAIDGSQANATQLGDFANAGYDSINNRVYSDLKVINGVAGTGARLEQIVSNSITVACSTTGSTTTVVDSSLSSTDDTYNGRVFIFDSDTATTALQGQAGVIDDYTGLTGTMIFPVNTFTTGHSGTDTGIIL